MGIKLHKESDTRYKIVWSTDIKEENKNDPTSLVIPYSVKESSHELIFQLVQVL